MAQRQAMLASERKILEIGRKLAECAGVLSDKSDGAIACSFSVDFEFAFLISL